MRSLQAGVCRAKSGQIHSTYGLQWVTSAFRRRFAVAGVGEYRHIRSGLVAVLYRQESFDVGEQMLAGPEWEQLYQQALLELDEARLAELVLRAEQAMRKRLSVLQSNGKSRLQFEERHKLEDALTSLEFLRRISTGQLK